MNFINKWKDKIAHYVDVRVQLVKLDIIERTSGVLSYLIFIFICLFLALTILIFLGIVLGELFSGLIGSRPLGYLVTSGIYVLLMGLMFALRKPILDTFSGAFIRILTHEDEGDEEEHDQNKS